MITSKIVKILGLVRLLAHKSRQDCMAGIIQGMIESCSVQFHQIAYKLNPGAKHSSNVRRIERFFQEQELDYDRLALLLAFFLTPPAQSSFVWIALTGALARSALTYL